MYIFGAKNNTVDNRFLISYNIEPLCDIMDT